jgi:hypothetical protein
MQKGILPELNVGIKRRYCICLTKSMWDYLKQNAKGRPLSQYLRETLLKGIETEVEEAKK